MAGSSSSALKSWGVSVGNAVGTKSPPSGASPCISATLNPTAREASRVLTEQGHGAHLSPDRPRALKVNDPGVGGETHGCELGAHAGHHRRRRRLAFAQANIEAPRLRIEQPQGAGAAWRRRAPVESPESAPGAAARDHHVLERGADQSQVVGVAAGNEAGEIRGLPDKIRQVHRAFEHGARRAGGAMAICG